MKKIYLNLKRFDIAKSLGGVNDIGGASVYAEEIVRGIEKGVKFDDGIDFTVFFQEGHLLNASAAAKRLKIGCQGVFRRDVEIGGNFGAFTTLQTAKSATGLGATAALIGHCEERNNLREIIEMSCGSDFDAINRILNEEIKQAVKCGMSVLYCVGERSEEQENRYDVLRRQLEIGLKDVDLACVSIAYEPVWAIGPGKTPASAEYIADIARFIKSVKDVPVVYGGGLKQENAEEIAKIPEVDGGLIALTTFGKDFGFSVDNYLKIVEKYKQAL